MQTDNDPTTLCLPGSLPNHGSERGPPHQSPISAFANGDSQIVTPRPYQLAIFERAKSENIIAVLDTGSGKTLIAVLLLKHAALERATLALAEQKKISVFLVPAVPLVYQQANYIRYNTNLVVRHYYGEMGVDSVRVSSHRFNLTEPQWSRDHWRGELSAADCLVMTPAILENILRKSFIAMSKIDLLIFDECHHARKNSVYNQIVSLYYLNTPLQERPRLFGMTASPASARADLLNSVKQLEANLCCKAVTSDKFDSLSTIVRRPLEETAEYAREYRSADFREAIMPFSNSTSSLVRKIVTGALSIADELGVWFAVQYIALALAHGQNSGTAVGAMVMDDNDLLTNDITLEGAELIDMESYEEVDDYAPVADFEAFIKEKFHVECMKPDDVDAYWTPPSTNVLSPKVQKLISVLEGYHPQAESFCGIIFVEKRWTAKLLGSILRSVTTLSFLKIGLLVGHGYSNGLKGIDFSMPVSRQKETVKSFKSGTINLLIATQVAEEGLDIQPCVLVIRFDMFRTLSQYIQSRGRARHQNARYILLLAADDHEASASAKAMQDDEQTMRNMLIDRDAGDGDDLTHEIDPKSLVYVVSETGAKESLYSAVSSVYHYCALLPQDSNEPLQPIFTTGPSLAVYPKTTVDWITSVKLPLNVPAICQYITGRSSDSKSTSIRLASLAAIDSLHKESQLDNHLFPVGRSKEKHTPFEGQKPMDEVEELVEPLPDENAISDFDVTVPSSFCSNWADRRGWLITIKLKDKDDTGRILEFGMLSPFEICLDGLGTYSILFGSDEKQVEITMLPRPCNIADRFPLLPPFQKVFFGAILRTKPNSGFDFVFMVVPLKNCGGIVHIAQDLDPEDLVDWKMLADLSSSCWSRDEVIQAGYFRKEDEEPVDFLKLFEKVGQQLIVGDRAYYNRMYRVTKVLALATPLTFGPSGFDSISAFYRKRLRVTEKIRDNQPVLQATALPHVWQSGLGESSSEKKFMYLIPQFCTPYPLSWSSMISSSLFFPLIIQELWCRLMTNDIRVYLKLSDVVSASTFQTAFISSAARKPQSYERLEFLGDSFLKMHLALHLFVHHPSKHEGLLSTARTRLERNTNLCRLGVTHGFPRAALVEPLSRKSWYPPMFTRSIKSISNKTIADIVEAVIGTCIVDSGTGGGCRAVSALFGEEYRWTIPEYVQLFQSHLNVTELVLNDDSENSGRSLAVKVDAVFGIIGYRFKNPLLLAEAFTHSSAVGITSAPCYQRLEFLGDAVIGYLMSRLLFLTYSHMNPGDLSELKSELVSNQFLATASCQLGLSRMMVHVSAALASALSKFTEELESVLKNPDHDRYFWRSLPNAPKAAGDVYEAIIGAILLDSGGDLQTIEGIMRETLLKPYPLFENKQPGKVIGVVADLQSRFAALKCRKVSYSLDHVEDPKSFSYVISCHGETVAAASGGSKQEAKIAACRAAICVIKDGLPQCSCNADSSAIRAPLGKKEFVDPQSEADDSTFVGVVAKKVKLNTREGILSDADDELRPLPLGCGNQETEVVEVA
ncbi:hypothetical protein DFJ73DRAFT_623667 [Zopfochytrium polystomum]|nr:hypothetical protein DFJ73DRAFT_623667 [Zopfochytrium polystomum]